MSLIKKGPLAHFDCGSDCEGVMTTDTTPGAVFTEFSKYVDDYDPPYPNRLYAFARAHDAADADREAAALLFLRDADRSRQDNIALCAALRDAEVALEEIAATPRYPCYRCGGTQGERGVTHRKIEMHWESEPGDYGTILSSWPVFEIEPACKGADPSFYGTDDFMPRSCPFHEEYDALPDDQQQGVIEVFKLVKIARAALARIREVNR